MVIFLIDLKIMSSDGDNKLEILSKPKITAIKLQKLLIN